MMYKNHRSGSVSYKPKQGIAPSVASEERSGSVSNEENQERPRVFGSNQCERIEMVDGELKIVDC